ncbi:MAG TPA: amino acid adenylation domain-containing protein [Candidatus Angelobacter sp.]|nr:amino acid adenylation domain-containing protein [Candidatus Angelobacter sp.]
MELEAIKARSTTESAQRALWQGFCESAAAFPGRPALEVAGSSYTYAQLYEQAASLAATLKKQDAGGETPLTAVFAYRSVTAFAGVLAALFRGHGYVPLNRTFPVERSKGMLTRSKCRAMIVDAQSERQLEVLLEGATESYVILLPERADASELARRWPRHRFLGKADLEPANAWGRNDFAASKFAYLLFTSGSTGIPKGVLVSQANVQHYVKWTIKRYGIAEADRHSQTFDFTFDLSAHDMFVTWEAGACLCCPSQKQLIKPGAFIRDSKLTIWFSVPSTGVFMRRLGMLKPDMYPNLRLTLFCGEALPMETARDWAKAAPNSVIENIYGPTELTIACTAYRWNEATSPAECVNETVPIGQPFDGMQMLVVNEELKEVPPGQDGELLMTGPQLSCGYWHDEAKTKAAFVTPPGKEAIFYRTGDRVRRPKNGEPLVYLGRIDNQVKIMGHRVELGEIEAAIRRFSGMDGVVALGWPLNAGGADGVVAFVETETLDTAALSENLKTKLPAYMIPRHFHALRSLPLNANGKYDRKALTEMLKNKL